jgi:hypothetical protein
MRLPTELSILIHQYALRLSNLPREKTAILLREFAIQAANIVSEQEFERAAGLVSRLNRKHNGRLNGEGYASRLRMLKDLKYN